MQPGAHGAQSTKGNHLQTPFPQAGLFDCHICGRPDLGSARTEPFRATPTLARSNEVKICTPVGDNIHLPVGVLGRAPLHQIGAK